MRRQVLSAALAGMTLCLTPNAWAHHSQSEFDFNSTVEVQGSVTNLDWRSPHARLYVDVTDAQGKIAHWDFEMPSPMTLMRRGWTRKSLKPGDKVTVKGAKAKHFPDIGYLILVKDATGKPLFTGVTEIIEPKSDSKPAAP